MVQQKKTKACNWYVYGGMVVFTYKNIWWYLQIRTVECLTAILSIFYPLESHSFRGNTVEEINLPLMFPKIERKIKIQTSAQSLTCSLFFSIQRWIWPLHSLWLHRVGLELLILHICEVQHKPLLSFFLHKPRSLDIDLFACPLFFPPVPLTVFPVKVPRFGGAGLNKCG